MARKKAESVATRAPEQAAEPDAHAAAEKEAVNPAPESESALANPATDHEGPRDEPNKNWGPAYVARFTCSELGFELGENRRYKQRVFSFKDKPSEEILAELKDNGFTYRAAEKTWTIQSTADTRKLTDDLARKWAGPNYVQGMER